MKYLRLVCLACAATLLIVPGAATRAYSPLATHPAAAPEAEQIVEWFLAAIYFGEYDRLRSLADPSFHFDFEPGTAAAHSGNLDQFIAWVRSRHVSLNRLNSGFASGAVTSTIVVTATDLPRLPHPHVVNAKFVVSGFQVVSFVAEPDDQTRADLAALPQSKLPNAGIRSRLFLFRLLALAVVCLVAGSAVRGISYDSVSRWGGPAEASMPMYAVRSCA